MSKPNILLIVLDTVRYSNMGFHGYSGNTTPFLTDFADQATVYNHAYAPSTWSLPSHVSMFTGLHVPEHRVISTDYSLDPGHTIWEELHREHGYKTGIFSENVYLTELDVGLKSAFQKVGSADTHLTFPNGLDPYSLSASTVSEYLSAFLTHSHPLRSLGNGVFAKISSAFPNRVPSHLKTHPAPHARTQVRSLLDWIDSVDQPWAACVNFLDAHYEYSPLPEHDLWGSSSARMIQKQMDHPVWEALAGDRPWWQVAALQGLYDGGIHEADAGVQQIIEELQRNGELENTLVVITSDHGETFGTPSEIKQNIRLFGHHYGANEELTHVPLIVSHPYQKTGHTTDQLATLTGFPQNVRNLLKNRGEDGFTQTRPVWNSGHNLDQPREQDKALNYLNDIDDIFTSPETLYEQRDGRLLKYSQWGDSQGTFEITETGVRQIETTTRGKIADTKARFSDQNVRSRSGLTNLSEDVERQLEDLGYA